MSFQQFLDHEIFTRAKAAGTPRFERASFTLDYKGKNTLGNHDSELLVTFYEPFENDDCIVTVFNEPDIKSTLRPQINAGKLPDFFIMPDFYHNQDDFNDGTVSHTAYIWDKNVSCIEIDLLPYYDLKKCIFVHKRFANLQQTNEIHLLVNPRKI